MLPYAPCYGDRINFLTQKSFNKEIMMSKAMRKARPVVEATLVSVALVAAALAVPVAIVYAAI